MPKLFDRSIEHINDAQLFTLRKLSFRTNKICKEDEANRFSSQSFTFLTINPLLFIIEFSAGRSEWSEFFFLFFFQEVMKVMSG